jgi:predicted nucleic acid-binding Zn ribbon protein
MKQCIVCEKKIIDKGIEKHEVTFCSESCLEVYEKKLQELNKIVNWDNCC